MRVATVTWITFNNYGTQLQAYALQKYLLHLGVDNFIVSDKKIVEALQNKNTSQNLSSNTKRKPQYEEKNARQYITLNPTMLLRKLRKCIRKQKKRTGISKATKVLKKSERKYVNFKKKKLNIVYGYSKENLHKLDQICDTYICGSDQIWSLLKKNFDDYFFLGFTNKKKISYATSIGANGITEEQANILRGLLRDFSCISVREKRTAEQLTERISKNVEWVSDPTLLFNSAFWENATKNIYISESKYVLCYFLENKEWYFEYAQRLSKQLGLKILLLPSRYEYCFNDNVYAQGVGPLEFVKLIEKADFILTDSYHGALFSLNYSKQFMYLKRFDDEAYDCQNIRIYSILEYLELMDLIVEEQDFKDKNILTINYEMVSGKIDKLRQDSRDYLYRSLYEEK